MIEIRRDTCARPLSAQRHGESNIWFGYGGKPQRLIETVDAGEIRIDISEFIIDKVLRTLGHQFASANRIVFPTRTDLVRRVLPSVDADSASSTAAAREEIPWTVVRQLQGAKKGKALRQRWHSWHCWQCGLCNLQNLKEARETESLSLRHL
jgi:hypothetical protein